VDIQCASFVFSRWLTRKIVRGQEVPEDSKTRMLGSLLSALIARRIIRAQIFRAFQKIWHYSL
jgi:hypothetical protein